MKNLVVSRSRKTGKSRGYGFVQFEDPLVARIAAETLNGYPLSDRVLKSHVVDPEKTHPAMFRHANRKWKNVPRRTVRRQFEDVPVPKDAAHLRLERLVERERAQEEKWKSLGIDYEFENSYAKQITEMSSEEDSDNESEEGIEEIPKQTPVANKKRTRNAEDDAATPSKKTKASNSAKAEERAVKADPVNAKSPKKEKNVSAKVEAVTSKVSKSPKNSKSK